MFEDTRYGPAGYCPSCHHTFERCLCFETFLLRFGYNEVRESHTEYMSVLSSGMFWEWYPKLTGIWAQDKEQWQVIFKELQETRNR